MTLCTLICVNMVDRDAFSYGDQFVLSRIYIYLSSHFQHTKFHLLMLPMYKTNSLLWEHV